MKLPVKLNFGEKGAQWRRCDSLRGINEELAINDIHGLNGIYKNVEEYDQNTKRKLLIVIDDMITDMLGNKKLNPMVTELSVRGKKIKHFPCFYYTVLFCCKKIY